jgi:hypothetical protein
VHDLKRQHDFAAAGAGLRAATGICCAGAAVRRTATGNLRALSVLMICLVGASVGFGRVCRPGRARPSFEGARVGNPNMTSI